MSVMVANSSNNSAGFGGYNTSAQAIGRAAEVAENCTVATKIGLNDIWREEESVASVEGLHGLSVTMHRHLAHGTTLVAAHVGGPLCSVGLFFGTEANDDKGLVHCLEHLCFMGSRSYRKGYLDFLATRCGCDGTNAYTDADHTCFEFDAVGQVGLLAVLPVFIDHVLCPALTEDSFVTEIYHINGKGQRQGVVFSEMLGRVTDEAEMLDLELRRATFGDESPYSYEHGGLPEQIMKLKREDIVNYHRQVYTTDNLHIVIVGTFDEGKVLSAVHNALDAAVTGGAHQHCQKRPFCALLPSLPASCPRRRAIKFPSDDVSVGSVAYSHRLDGVGFRDMLIMTALDVLGRYLTGLASSPLEQAFVQCDPPVASGVSLEVNLTAEPHFELVLQGVPFNASEQERAAAKRLRGDSGCGEGTKSGEKECGDDTNSGGNAEDDEEEEDQAADAEEDGNGDECDEDEEDNIVHDWFAGNCLLLRLVSELRNVHASFVSGDEAAMTDLRRAIKKENVSRRVNFEDTSNEFVRGEILPNLLFCRYPSGDRCEGAPRVLQFLSERTSSLESLLEKDGSWWAALLDKQLLSPLVATSLGHDGGVAEVRACPSAVFCLQNERKEEKEAKRNAKTLGKKKLKILQERVDAAEEANRVSLEDSWVNHFPPPITPDCVPDMRWEMQLIEAPVGGIEILDVEVSSSFVELQIHYWLDDAALPGRASAELQMYLNLFASLMCETDVAGESYRSVVARLDDELVSYSASYSCGSEMFQAGSSLCAFSLKLSAERERSPELVAWANRLIHDCDYPEERVLSTCRRLITGLKESMRDGEAVLTQVMTTAVHGPLAPQVLLGALAQRSFLERCTVDLAATCNALRRLRDTLTAPTTACAAIVSGNDDEGRSVVRDLVWKAWRRRHDVTRPSFMQAVKWTAISRTRCPPLLPVPHFVVGCAGVDAAHVHLRAEIPVPHLALDGKRSWALRLLCEAISMMEGPLTSVVRGKGLAYGASVGFIASENAVTLDLMECTNVRKCLEGVSEMLRHAIQDDVLNPFQLDNARGSLVFHLKSDRATPHSVVGAAVDAASRGWRSAAEVAAWEACVGTLTQADVLAALDECLLRLCDASKVTACVVCDPSDCRQMAKGLAAGLGVEVNKVYVRDNISDCYELIDGRIRAALQKKYPPDDALVTSSG